MKKSKFIPRLILVVILLLSFTYLAFMIFIIQDSKLSLLSFKVSPEANVMIVSDLDRLVSKLDYDEEIKIGEHSRELKEGFDLVLSSDSVKFNGLVSKEIAVSFTDSDFSVAYEDGWSLKALSGFINEDLGIEAEFEAGKFAIAGFELFAKQYGDFKCLSTKPIKVEDQTDNLEYGSADYLVFSQNNPRGVRHMISASYHFTLSENEATSMLGKTFNSEEYFKLAPGEFDELQFYGSTRFTEDLGALISPESVETFEFLLAREKAESSLSFILEEETLNLRSDSGTINYFNIGKYKVQPFESNRNWQSIPSLSEEMSFYTEINDFIVLSNSIPAMRWYLGEVQLGNLLEQSVSNYKLYTDCLPNASHQISMQKLDGVVSCSSAIFQKNGFKLLTAVETIDTGSDLLGLELEINFPIDFAPSNIQIDKAGIVLNNSSKVAMFSMDGEELWEKSVSTFLVEAPQIVDFNNDGKSEFVLFSKSTLDVLNIEGQSLNGFPVNLTGDSKAGLAVNYDQKYNYRIIVNQGKKIRVYDEGGKNVDGWVFDEMSSILDGKIYHVLTAGKDIIAFKDSENQQYILNRRGESRLSEAVHFELKNETDFVVGGMESSLRKMGYSNGYIHNYYVLDGQRDSVKLDQFVLPAAIHWEYNKGNPLLIIEESERLLIADQFGYIKSEVLKPKKTNKFAGLVGTKEYGFVFSDNSQNSIYLLNNFGKMMLPQAVEGSSVCAISEGMLLTYSGISIKAYKL